MPTDPKPHAKRIGGNSQTDIHNDINPPESRPQEGAGRQDVMESSMGGAGDGNSGGGAGAGIPGGGTDLRTDGRFDRGDVEEDRKKIFPEAKTHRDASTE